MLPSCDHRDTGASSSPAIGPGAWVARALLHHSQGRPALPTGSLAWGKPGELFVPLGRACEQPGAQARSKHEQTHVLAQRWWVHVPDVSCSASGQGEELGRDSGGFTLLSSRAEPQCHWHLGVSMTELQHELQGFLFLHRTQQCRPLLHCLASDNGPAPRNHHHN